MPSTSFETFTEGPIRFSLIKSFTPNFKVYKLASKYPHLCSAMPFILILVVYARPEYQKNKLLCFLCNIPHKYPSQTTQYSMHFLGLFRFIAHICSSCVTDLCSTKPSQKEEREITPKNIQGYTPPWAKSFRIPMEK